MMNMSPKGTTDLFGNTCDQRLEPNIFKNKQFELTAFMFTFIDIVYQVVVTVTVLASIFHPRTLGINIRTFFEKFISLLHVTV